MEKTTEQLKNKANKVAGRVASDAKGTASDAKEMFDTAVEGLPEIAANVAQMGKEFLNSISSSKMISKAGTQLKTFDKSLRMQPWAFVGGAAVLGFVSGFLLGRRTKSDIPSKIETTMDEIKGHLQ